MLVLILNIKTTLSQTVEVCASVWVDFVKNTQTLSYSLKIDAPPPADNHIQAIVMHYHVVPIKDLY